MNSTKSQRTHWLKSFRIFVGHFCHICFVIRGVLGVHLLLVIGGGLAFSFCEGISTWSGIYFAVITSTSVGFGDIEPGTVAGQCIGMGLAIIGTIFVGLVVGAATRAIEVTVLRDYRNA
jgi:hypothetical protein